MYSNCYSPVPVTELEEIHKLIDRFYKQGGRLAEASGAESMLPYIVQRDEYMQDLENMINDRSNEARLLRDEKDKVKRESETHASMYRTARSEADKLTAERNDLKRLLKEMTLVKGFGKNTPKKLRDKIKLIVA